MTSRMTHVIRFPTFLERKVQASPWFSYSWMPDTMTISSPSKTVPQ